MSLGQDVAGPEDCPDCRRLAGQEIAGAIPPSYPAPPSSTAASPEATEAHEPPPPGSRRFQHYEVCLRGDGVNLHELGRGAMGVTYRALDTNLGSPVALKIIGARFSADAQARERFRREARSAAHLRHPNVASVFHFGEENGQCFYAMELIEGETLQERVRREGPQPPGAVLEVGLQVARALMAAEAHGLVHRDLKPSNLMLLAGGPGSDADAPTVKIIDFGLAKATAAARGGEGDDLTHGDFIGTPAFASPEQFSGGEASPDTRSDIYSLGATLWYLLCGKSPFAGRTLAEIHDRQTRRPLPLEQLKAARVPTPLVALLRSMLASDPTERPSSARELAERLRRCREEVLGVAAATRPGRRRAWRVAAGALALLTLGSILAAGFFAGRAPRGRPDAVQPTATTLTPTEKSVAVLPFENRSADPENAFFADGVQDEILVDLAKVADLKVISRTSVMQYRDTAKRDLREIARALGVTHVVEGSVQRAGNQIRVTAQLIDARTDAHRWAEHYDRPLDNVFALQSEIAQAIAGQLQVKLSPQERAAMAEVPTNDEQAYHLYLSALSEWNKTSLGYTRANLEHAADLLEQAVARDPQFTRAFALLADTRSELYFYFHRVPTEAEAARAAAETVARLRPGSAEARLAMGYCDYYVRSDYPRASEDFAEVVRRWPNEAQAWSCLGYVNRRQGRWEEAITGMRRATELDPGNESYFEGYLDVLRGLHRHHEMETLLDRQIALHPRQPTFHIDKANFLVSTRADTRAARAELAQISAGHDPDGAVTYIRVDCDELDRDWAAAQRDLAACPLPEIVGMPRQLREGFIARGRGDAAAAAAAFAAARASFATDLRDQPDNAYMTANLAMADACLGHKEAAVTGIRRALALLPADDTVAVLGMKFSQKLFG